MSAHAIADVGPCHNVFISPVDAYQVAAYRMSNLIFSIEINSFLLGRSGGRWLVQRIQYLVLLCVAVQEILAARRLKQIRANRVTDQG